MKQMYFGGCDVGSTTGKAVIIDEKGKLVSSSIVPSEIDPKLTARYVLKKAVSQINDLKSHDNLTYLIGTGYGRYEVPFANENISEISCHAIGAFFVNPRIRTILDLGGQDLKGISVHDDGSVRDFVMNDKCAAGTGRFFEAMSRIFRMNLEEFSKLSLKAKKIIPVTSQCSVFAETEVISLLAKKLPPANIAAGIQLSVAKRCITLLKRVGMKDKITVSGGCAKNIGLIKLLEKNVGIKMAKLKVDPQLLGAIGAAVLAGEKYRALKKDII